MKENDKPLLELADLLWSIGDTLDEMDRTGKKLWNRIGKTEKRIRERAEALPDTGIEGKVKRKILGTTYLYLWWGSCVDLIEDTIGQTRPIQ